MSKILARFKRASSTSSEQDDQLQPPSSPRRYSASSSASDEENHTNAPPLGRPVSSSGTTSSGSHFIEEFGDAPKQNLSPLNSRVAGGAAYLGGTPTPSPSKRIGLDIPDSGTKIHPPAGTPKFTLTDPGSNSPRSFSSSPGKDSPAGQQRPSGLGLGIGTQAQELYGVSMDSPKSSYEEPLIAKAGAQPIPPTQERRNSKSNLSIASAPPSSTSTARDPSELTVDQETRKQRSGSIISRLKAGGTSPKLSPTHLDVKPEAMSMSGKEKRHRRLSASSGKAKTIAAAIVGKAGHNITGLLHHGHHGEENHNKASSLRIPHSSSMNMDDATMYGDDDDDDDSGSELDDDLPVTGFAVASNRRNADFHAMFPTVDEGDYLIEDYGCALSKDILVQGRLYVSENHICFHANIFGWVTDVVVPFSEIKLIEKKMTALVIPNAIGISTAREKYSFASLISRDTTYDVMMNIWRLCNPNAVMSSLSLATTSRPASIAGTDAGDSPTSGGGNKSEAAPAKGHAPTQCQCGQDGKHYKEIALQTTLGTTPEKVFNLMFASEWVKGFMTGDQKLRELEISDWKPVADGAKLSTRTLSYIKPLNGSIGPKQTKCHIVDEQEHYDPETYISTMETTRTPDVPSGGVFSVKTKTCLMWAGSNSTKVVVTTIVEWTGKSWVKGIIEKSCLDGQKQYQNDLANALKKQIKENPGEYGAPEGTDQSDDPSSTHNNDEEGHTEASAYAAENRKKRQDGDMNLIQGGVDKVFSGFGAIGSGLSAVFSSVGDLISDLPIGKEMILGCLILILLGSNVYTYMVFKGRAPERLARRQGRENDLGEVVRLLLEKSGGLPTANERVQGHVNPREEVDELKRILDGVESRAAKLRSAITTIEGDVQRKELA